MSFLSAAKFKLNSMIRFNGLLPLTSFTYTHRHTYLLKHKRTYAAYILLNTYKYTYISAFWFNRMFYVYINKVILLHPNTSLFTSNISSFSLSVCLFLLLFPLKYFVALSRIISMFTFTRAFYFFIYTFKKNSFFCFCLINGQNELLGLNCCSTGTSCGKHLVGMSFFFQPSPCNFSCHHGVKWQTSCVCNFYFSVCIISQLSNMS